MALPSWNGNEEIAEIIVYEIKAVKTLLQTCILEYEKRRDGMIDRLLPSIPERIENIADACEEIYNRYDGIGRPPLYRVVVGNVAELNDKLDMQINKARGELPSNRYPVCVAHIENGLKLLDLMRQEMERIPTDNKQLKFEVLRR